MVCTGQVRGHGCLGVPFIWVAREHLTEKVTLELRPELKSQLGGSAGGYSRLVKSKGAQD